MEQGQDYRAALTLAVHARELLVGDQRGDDRAELAAEAIGRGEELTDLVGIVEAALDIRGGQLPCRFLVISRLLSPENVSRPAPMT